MLFLTLSVRRISAMGGKRTLGAIHFSAYRRRIADDRASSPSVPERQIESSR